jgi:hypothetical protein
VPKPADLMRALRADTSLECCHQYHQLNQLVIQSQIMKRATMTFPDDLAKAVEQYLASQEAPPTLTTVVQAALRQYLGERGFFRTRQTLDITPAKKGSGRSDASQHHDRYLAGTHK